MSLRRPLPSNRRAAPPLVIPAGALLLEDGSPLLLEDGSYLIVE